MNITHSFSVEIAQQVGVEGAILLNYFGFWHQRNEIAGNNLRDGRYWTYNTIKALIRQFPYWTPKQMRTLLAGLEKKEYLLTDHLGGSDRTTWYALTDKSMVLLELIKVVHLPFAQTGNSSFPNGQMQMAKQAVPISQTGNSNFPNGQMQMPKQAVPFAQTGNSNFPNGQMLYNDTISNTITEPVSNADETRDANFSISLDAVITPGNLEASPREPLQSSAKVSPKKSLVQPFFQDSDDWPTRLLVDRLFLEGCAKNLKLRDEPLRSLLGEFDTEQTTIGKTHTNYKDYKAHAYNWLRIQSEKNQRNGSTTRKSADPGPAGPGSVIRREYKQQSFRRSDGVSGTRNDE